MRKKGDNIQSESWASFHSKHQSDSFRYSTRNERYATNNVGYYMCYDDTALQQASSFWESFIGLFTIESPSSQRRVANDDTSMGSSDSSRSGGLRRLRVGGRKRRKQRKQGNIKISEVRW
uniref:Uncharacterized protein n=1 Tax=Grammatophora oceanica TaxID=210454 RepID=A0A7S1Y937_9STRA|mmetsp:Transcript_32503/g.48229  ORF Transcript_32503/g.48229 Transcript_32503/m.48229 type:complete len:120 (+) Transcript_32503:207-566(+)